MVSYSLFFHSEYFIPSKSSQISELITSPSPLVGKQHKLEKWSLSVMPSILKTTCVFTFLPSSFSIAWAYAPLHLSGDSQEVVPLTGILVFVIYRGFLLEERVREIG